MRIYRIEAVRQFDGATLYAIVHVPPMVTLTFNDHDPSAMEVVFEGDDIRVNPCRIPRIAVAKFSFSHS